MRTFDLLWFIGVCYCKPTLLSPASNGIVYCGRYGPTPRFTWDSGLQEVPLAIDGGSDTVIQISTSPNFMQGKTVVDKVPAILSRYVRAKPLGFAAGSATAVFYWKVQVEMGEWSEVGNFTAMLPERLAKIPARIQDWQAVQVLWVTLICKYITAFYAHLQLLCDFRLCWRQQLQPKHPTL
jgi:hypothetical protein